MSKILVIAATIVALSAAVTPAAAQSREQRQMMATLQMLQEQAQQLAITMAALQQSVDDSVKALNARIDEANTASRRSFADQKVAIDNISSELGKVRERADDTNVRLGRLSDELEAVRTTVLALPQQLSGGAALGMPAPAGAPGADPGSQATVPPPPVPSTAGLSPNRLYETARLDYFNGQYDVALAGFEQLLRAYPRIELSDDAQFGICEVEFARNNLAAAVSACNGVIQTYPTTNSVPSALYKRGLAQERLGQVDAARASYEAVVKTYGDTPEGILATQSLGRLAARRP